MPTARLNGIDLRYEVHGHGQPLVLVMGLGGPLQSWYFQVRAFRKHYRVVTFDNRGVGRTSDDGSPFTIKTMAQDTIALLDHLAIEQTHLLGYSLGGTVAQQVAILAPHRVRSLILASTTALGPGAGHASEDMHRALGRGDEAGEAESRSHPGNGAGPLDLSGLMPGLVDLAFGRPGYRRVLKPLARLFQRSGGFAGLDRQIAAVMATRTLDQLPEIRAPTLVLTGTADRVVPPAASEQLAAQIRGARLVLVKGGSHAFAIETPGRFNKPVLDFLQEVSHTV